MRIAYLTNQYPKVSHSFIRREIAALEARGVVVDRFTLREVDEPLVDREDLAERTRTTLIIDSPRSLATATSRRAGKHPARFASAVRACVDLGLRTDSAGHRAAGYLASACRLADELEHRGIQHVHAHFGTNPAAVAMLCSILSDTTYSFTVHGPEEFDAVRSLSLPQKIDRAAFVVAISSFGESQLRRLVPASAWSKIVVVRCGLDASFLDTAVVPTPDVRTIVSVGRLAEQKGQLTLVDAVAAAARRGASLDLVLVGDGPMRGAIEARARELGIADRVTITGWADANEVRRRIESARVFVLPSYAEGLPIVLMEALALGRAVVSTFVAGIPELVESGVNGWLVPAGSVDALADTLVRCASTPTGELDRMGREGRERVKSLHDARTNAATLERCFARVLGAEREHPSDRTSTAATSAERTT